MRKKYIALFAAALACPTLLAGCDKNDRNDKLYAELMAAPPPTIRESKAPFTLGGLIPPTTDTPYWSVEYGDFPVIISSDIFANMANGFARAQLGSPGRYPDSNGDYEFIMTASTEYAMTLLTDGGSGAYYMYDPEQNVRFDESAAVNLLLLTDVNRNYRDFPEIPGDKIITAEIARDAVAFVTPEDNPISGLTYEQIQGLLTGKITDWAQLGGADLPVTLYYESHIPLLEEALNSHIPEGEELRGPEMEETEQGRLKVWVYSQFTNAPGSIAIAFLRDANEIDGAKILSVDGASPDAETIRSGRYPVIFGCFAVYRASDSAGAPGKFVEWMLTSSGAKLIESVGLVPAQK